MTVTRRLALFAVAVLVAACGGSTSPSPSESAAAQSATPPASMSAEPTATPDACAAPNLATKSAGKLTIGTDNPAYPPYFQPNADNSTDKFWQLGVPTNGQGFEAAFAYALAAKLGFDTAQVDWTYIPFDLSYAPGDKGFDLDINQVSYLPERATAVDLSDGYYFVAQAVVTLEGSKIAKATTIAELKGATLGAQVGTTSYKTITEVVAPSTQPMVYDTNDAAVAALIAKQIDGLVVDLPTAFYIIAAQLEGGKIVGQFPVAEGPDAEHFSVVLQKGSPLTACVNQAIAALKSDGTLGAITQEWLADKASAPVLK